MDRPSRKTKVVNYLESNNFDEDDDDDFACVKAPPSKKSRDDVKQPEHRKSSSQEANSQSSQKNRKPLVEKVYERDLEAAITLSLLNKAEEIPNQLSSSGKDVKMRLPADENTDPSSRLLSNCSVDAASLGLDEITPEKVLATAVASWQRRAEVPKKKTKEEDDDDDDYRPKATPDSESDDDFSEPDESEDEEFTLKKSSKSKKKQEKVTRREQVKSPPTAAKKQKLPPKSTHSKSKAVAASAPERTPPPPLPKVDAPIKPAPKRPASCTLPSSKPAVPLSPAGGRIPKWNPPGQIGKSPSSSHNPAVKSPGQGLRLGLSRRVRVVKPLHPGVASH